MCAERQGPPRWAQPGAVSDLPTKLAAPQAVAAPGPLAAWSPEQLLQVTCVLSCSVLSDSLPPCGLWACQLPLSLELFKQDPISSAGDLLDPGIEPASSALAGGFFTPANYHCTKILYHIISLPLPPLSHLGRPLCITGRCGSQIPAHPAAARSVQPGWSQCAVLSHLMLSKHSPLSSALPSLPPTPHPHRGELAKHSPLGCFYSPGSQEN